MDYVVPLTKATEPGFVGGKAANLGMLLAAGIPVPPGFVVTTAAFDQHLNGGLVTELITRSMATIKHGASVEEIEVLANEVRRAIKTLRVDAAFVQVLHDAYQELRASLVAVRSSATVEDGTTAAWAGQLESYLYIDSEVALFDAVFNCWASLYTPRALSYRLAQGLLDKPVSVAVVIQRMIV